LRFSLTVGVLEVLAGAGGDVAFEAEEAVAPVLAELEMGKADVGGAGAGCGGFGIGLSFGLGRETSCDWEDDVVEVVAEVGAGAGAGAGVEGGLDSTLLELVDDLLDWMGATLAEGDLLVNEPFVWPEDVDAIATGDGLVAVLEAFEVFGQAGLYAAAANDRLVRKASTIMQPKMLTSQSRLLGGVGRDTDDFPV
jgi:hypothetical protein